MSLYLINDSTELFDVHLDGNLVIKVPPGEQTDLEQNCCIYNLATSYDFAQLIQSPGCRINDGVKDLTPDETLALLSGPITANPILFRAEAPMLSGTTSTTPILKLSLDLQMEEGVYNIKWSMNIMNNNVAGLVRALFGIDSQIREEETVQAKGEEHLFNGSEDFEFTGDSHTFQLGICRVGAVGYAGCKNAWLSGRRL